MNKQENKIDDPGDYCEVCDRKVKADYELDNGEYCCKDCYDDAVARAEYAYESMKENEVTGN